LEPLRGFDVGIDVGIDDEDVDDEETFDVLVEGATGGAGKGDALRLRPTLDRAMLLGDTTFLVRGTAPAATNEKEGADKEEEDDDDDDEVDADAAVIDAGGNAGEEVGGIGVLQGDALDELTGALL
jgi:hypothetical protein